jgi:hypothetical protein
VRDYSAIYQLFQREENGLGSTGVPARVSIQKIRTTFLDRLDNRRKGGLDFLLLF